MKHAFCAIFIFQTRSRACLKNHFRNLQAPLCGIFYPHSVAVARYAALIRIKSPTNWDSQLTKSLFRHALVSAAQPFYRLPFVDKTP